MSFNHWIDTFLDEKGIDTEDRVSVDGDMGMNSIPVGCLVDMMKQAPAHEQNGIKAMLVKIDVAAAGRKPVLDYFTHLAKAVAI